MLIEVEVDCDVELVLVEREVLCDVLEVLRLVD